jgi:putative ABC transport system permease protein
MTGSRSARRSGLRASARRTMPAGEILFIFKARLKSRVVFVQDGIAVLGIAIGVALLFASHVASQSLDGSVRELTRQLVGGTQYQLDARGGDGFPRAVMTQAQALPGVRAALPLIEQQATIIGPRDQVSADLIGVDPRFAHLGGPLARKFSARELTRQKVVALPKPLAASIGAAQFEDIRLQAGAGVREVLLAATLGSGEAGGLADSQIALAPIRYAQELVGESGRISRLYIKVYPGEAAAATAALRRLAAANRLNFVPADFDAQLFAIASAPAQQGESLFSGISAFVGFLFAFNAMLLTVGERRRLIETMRRRGTARLMIVQALAFDAVVIGVVASTIGLVLGEVLSIALFHEQPGYLAFAFPVGSQRIVTFSTFAEAAGAGVLAAIVGVLAPLRDILARPLRARVEMERTPPGWTVARVAAGLLCLAATTLILVFRPQSAVVGVITLVVASMALLPFLFNAIVLAFRRIQQPLPSTSTRLAVGELTDPLTRVRSLAVAATGAVAVFGSVAIAGAQQNLQRGLDRTAREWNGQSDVWISPSGQSNTLATTPFPASDAARLRGLPGIRSIGVYRGAFLNVGQRRLWVIAPPSQAPQPIPAGQLAEGDARVANRRLREGGWAVLSEAVAHEMNIRIGDAFTLPAPRPMTFRLAGLSTNSGWPPGVVVMNATDYAAAWATRAASALNVRVSSPSTPGQVRNEIAAALGPNSGLTVQTASERELQWKRISHQGLARLTQIAVLVSIAAILAMAGVMTSLIWQRRERIAYLKRTGNRRGLLWRSLFWESSVLLGSGCLIGAVFGLYGQIVISHALSAVTGFPIATHVGLLLAAYSFLIVSGAALAIIAAPGYLAVRIKPTMVKPA